MPALGRTEQRTAQLAFRPWRLLPGFISFDINGLWLTQVG
jgi:hypothetical protein